MEVGQVIHFCQIYSLRSRTVESRGESNPERRSGEKIIAGTAFRLEFQVR